MRIVWSLVTLFVAIPFCGFSYAINYAKVDSLNLVVQKNVSDSISVTALNQIALEYLNNKPDTAQLIGLSALKKAQKSKKKSLIGDCYYTLGVIARSEGQAVNTQFYLDSAIVFYQNDGNSYDNMKTDVLKARSYMKFGDFSKCVEMSTDLLLKIDSLNYPEFEPTLLNLIGIGHQNLEQNEEAYGFFLQALERAKELNDKRVEMWAYNNISSYYRHTKRFTEAVEFLKKAYDLAIEIDDEEQVSRSYSNLGATYHRMGWPDSAAYNLKKAYELDKAANNYYGMIKATWHLGEMYVDNNHPNLARPYLKESLRLARKYELDDDICYAYEYLYKAEQMSGNYHLAGQLADSLFECKEDFYNKNLAKRLSRATTLYEKAILEKETVKQKASIDILRVKNRNNKSFAVFIGVSAILLLLLGWLYNRNRQAKEKLELETFYQIEATKKLEEDRKNRAAELHDDIGQQLVLMKQMIDNKGDWQESKIMLQKAIDRVRAISRDEYPYQLKYLGLKTTLEDLIDRIENSSSIVVSEGFDDLPELPIESSLHLFRIVQECFSNTLKYSGAPSVQIKLSKDDDYLIMTYQDSGNPFDFQNKLNTSHSLGLKTIMDRVDILKGKVKELPSKGKGNKYLIHIPLSNVYGNN